ncbi:MAG TPA: protein-L-isoaspartate(D-aspartate) O-methyltransferase [Vicinamibacterales bacterium]|nr:protein-L-isoaspartate(D-aspartate) O-methyltransferase [Vicinamibacterales bacterium]
MTTRERMVAEQIRARGVADPRVLDAMSRVPRHLFIPEKDRGEAYEDRPVAIGFGQTISQPYIVGFMTESLQIEPSHRVLEIGTGCGYQTAVLAELSRDVYSIERIDALATVARRTLEALGYTNVHMRTGDGHAGWPEEAPYDRILGAAAAASLPPALVEQLVEGGILVIPVGTSDQQLQVLRKRGDTTQLLSWLRVRFVPMIREQ